MSVSAVKHLVDLDLTGNNILNAVMGGETVAVTQAVADDSTKLATTGFVKSVAASLPQGDMLVADYGGSASGIVATADVALSVDYGNIANLPSTFPPDAHTHSAADITDFNAQVDARVLAAVDSAAGVNDDLDTLVELINKVKDNADALDGGLIGRKNQLIGDGSATTFSVTHNLNSFYVQVQVNNVATGEIVVAGVALVNANTIEVTFATAPANDSYRVSVRN